MLEIIELPTFSKIVDKYWTDQEFLIFETFLVCHPEAGQIIKGSGGVRKIRWGYGRKGKRGGVRIIYYLANNPDRIYLMAIYSKGEAENIKPDVLKKLKKELD